MSDRPDGVRPSNPMRVARTWAIAMAVSPIWLPLVGICVSAVSGLLVGREAAGLAWNWVFSMLGGLPIFAPGIVATLLGGIRLGDRHTKVLIALGLILLTAAAAVTIADGVEENLGLDAADGPRFVAILSPAELLVFALPYALIILGCLVTGRQLWIAFRAVTPDADEHTSAAAPPITPRRW